MFNSGPNVYGERLRTRFPVLFFACFIICALIIGLRESPAWSADYWISVDEHDRPLPSDPVHPWYYNNTGGDRGLLNSGDTSYSWDGNSNYTATVTNVSGSWTWGGMWYSLIRIDRDNIPLNLGAIFGPYVASSYQGQITDIEMAVSNVSSPSKNADLQLTIQLKDINGQIVGGGLCTQTWTNLAAGSFPKSYTWTLPDACKQNVKELIWIIDKAQLGDSVSVDRVRMKAQVTDMPPRDQAFLWTYSWLMANYDPDTGMVQDRSNFGAGDDENVSATAKTAKIVYYAQQKGYTVPEQAETVIAKIANTLINKVPRGPAGVNTLWPHFTSNGGTQANTDSEWASGDTAFAALDIITALQLIGDPQGQIPALETFLQNIDWQALLMPDNSISLGYDKYGNLEPYSWKGFGMETAGVDWAYASVTGKRALMGPPPSDNGSGFIDNAYYPMVLSGVDGWGNNWNAYRSSAATTQMGWYCTSAHYNQCLCGSGLFGLSAAESPEADSYIAYGVGGSISAAQDGNDDVIAPHYSGMIDDLNPTQAERLWQVLRDSSSGLLLDKIAISPLNNIESMRVTKDTCATTINHLKGSWNMCLQAEGWASGDAQIRSALVNAVANNAFLKKGYDIIAPVINGACGSSNDGTFQSTPVTNLCSAGIASAVGGSGPWTWSCAGSNGGITTDCSANIQQYTVTPSPGANGVMTPSIPQTVNYNSTTSFTVVPNVGFGIASVTGCNGTLSGNTYNTGPITADCTVSATFTPTKGTTYKISGTVKNAAGLPMANVLLSLSGDALGITHTDSNGKYKFKTLPNGTYTIAPSKTGKSFDPVNRTIGVSGHNVIGQNFTGRKSTSNSSIFTHSCPK